MSGRPKIFIIAVTFGLSAFLGIIWVRVQKHHSTRQQTAAFSTLQKNSWTDESGDTNNEVLRTVVANQQKLQKQNQKLEQENDELRKSGIKNIQQTIEQSNKTLEDQFEQKESALEEKMTQQKQTIAELQEKLHQNGGGYEVSGITEETSGNVIRDVPDLSHVKVMNSPTPLKSDNSPRLPSDNEDTTQQIPYYTIPANSTLNHVSLMTSIIGEVPVSGHLVAPAFPFKAIVGKKDLFAANGLSIPSNIAGMVLSGYSVGNMTMSCARAYVTQILFVFKDGHFVVFPQKAESDATALYPKNALGYLSDPYGNTCISGKYITDAPKVITNMAAMGGIATGAGAVSQAQMTTMTNAFQTNSQLTGDLAKYIGGAFVNGAAQKALDWYTSRVSDVFDAVFIPAACHKGITKLVFNVTQTIPIDLNKTGRTLRYENNQFHHSHQLD